MITLLKSTEIWPCTPKSSSQDTIYNWCNDLIGCFLTYNLKLWYFCFLLYYQLLHCHNNIFVSIFQNLPISTYSKIFQWEHTPKSANQNILQNLPIRTYSKISQSEHTPKFPNQNILQNLPIKTYSKIFQSEHTPKSSNQNINYKEKTKSHPLCFNTTTTCRFSKYIIYLYFHIVNIYYYNISLALIHFELTFRFYRDKG